MNNTQDIQIEQLKFEIVRLKRTIDDLLNRKQPKTEIISNSQTFSLTKNEGPDKTIYFINDHTPDEETILKTGEDDTAGGTSATTITTTEYQGPFAITDTSADTGNPKVYVKPGFIILGIETVTFPGANLSISPSCYIYLTVEHNGSNYTLDLRSLSAYPGQTTDTYNIILGYIEYNTDENNDSILTITQHQYGEHYGTGRIF